MRDQVSTSSTIDHETRTEAALGWLPLIIIPGAAFLTRNFLPPWAFMWLMAFGLFVGCKWLTWWTARKQSSSVARSLGYLLLWPGMDALSFLDAEHILPKPRITEWLAAFAKTGFAITLIWVVAPLFSAPLLRGWVGMIGLVFLLHFGSFQMLALAWQALGVDAKPIMKNPGVSQSLSEFWGKRWNMGFRQLSYDLVFKPMQRTFGVAAALFASFIISGLIHELVISVPARAGYGLPTIYFALQGVGVLFERSRMGKRLGLDSGIRGWFFAVAIAGGPAYILFHPWFVLRVMVPFLRAIGA